jgi:MFS transporter, DHA1 family, inner membrane transport protein
VTQQVARSNRRGEEVAVAGTFRVLLALAMASFGIGTTEFVIMGLLPDVAHDLAVTIPQAGLLVSAYALGVAFGGPSSRSPPPVSIAVGHCCC